jgi:predicted nicotinamide N-methyase
VIGLDNPECVGFTRVINAGTSCRVVAAICRGSGAEMTTMSSAVNHDTIRSSVEQIPTNTKLMVDAGVQIVPTMDELLSLVDVVFLETRDGRPRYLSYSAACHIPRAYCQELRPAL